MADYIRWDLKGLGDGAEELRGAGSRLEPLAEDLRGIHRQLDPQLAGYEGIGRSLLTLLEGAEESARRLRNETGALEGAIAVYAEAEREAMRGSESLPTGIAERGLVFEGWFDALLK